MKTHGEFLTLLRCGICRGVVGGRQASGAIADDRQVVAFIGCGGRAKSLWPGFREHARVAWACDPDASRAASFQQMSGAANTTADLRRALDDKSVEAVVIATPDHWHAPAAILACEAGKHVYVEKPQSHNLLESRLLLDAARRNNVVVQHGTQSRSAPLIAGAVQMLREGVIGDVLVAKAWNIQRRANIGHQQPSDPPPGVDYDAWVGPAEFMPFQENRFHYHWHWWYNFGTGDIGNDGTHEIDYARWGLGVEGLPATATALGGKYYFDDDQQFPDTATCTLRVAGRRSGRQPPAVDLRDADLVAELPLQLRQRRRVLRHGRTHDAQQTRKVGDLRRSQPADRGRQTEATPRIDREPSARFPRRDPLRPQAQCRCCRRARFGRTGPPGQHRRAVGPIAATRPRQGTDLGDDEANGLLSRTYREGGHWAVPKGARS